MSQEGIQPLTSIVTSQGINHSITTSHGNKYCHSKKYKHLHFEFQTL